MPDKGPRRSKDESLKVLWKQFNSRFKTEEDCAEELFKRHSEAIQCRHCNCTEIESNYGARFGRCKKCRRKFWFTSGTFFNRIRLARPWLAAIWLMERGITINAGQLHRLVDIAISSAWALLKKLSMVIKNVMDSQPAVEQASENFAPAICKRSLETPAKLHPTNEGFEQKQQSKPTNRHSHSDPDLVRACIKFIRGHFHGTSRKYLQCFLAMHWCHIDRNSWPPMSLVKACRRSRHISYKEIRSYISPLQVNVTAGLK